MHINTEDITVPWGQQPDPLEYQFGSRRLAVYQDLQESLDGSKLFFLYDPVNDELSATTGARKGKTSILVFDTNRRSFVSELELRVQGRVRLFFALKTPAPTGGTALTLVTQSEEYGQPTMHLWRVNVQPDGLSLTGDPYSLLTAPLSISENFICSMREDAPELIVLFGPGLNVVRVNAAASAPSEPFDRFSVPGAELEHFYDAYVSIGNIYFVSATPDGHFDNSRIHVLNLVSRGPITTHQIHPDPQRGYPSARKNAGMDSIAGFILMAGGEIDLTGQEGRDGQVRRLVDYWVLDLTTMKWNQVPAQTPVALIEPRITTANSGNVYVWGDFDEPLPGMPSTGTHLRILRVTGFNTLAPPPYAQAMNQAPPPYPGSGGSAGGPTAPYPPGPGWNSSPSGAPPGGNYPPPAGGASVGYGGGSTYPAQSTNYYSSAPQTYGSQPQQTYPYYPPK